MGKPKNFINQFIEYTESAESPTSYFYWTAVAMVAAVLRDKVKLVRGLQTIYPNVYVLLLSKASSNTRKGTALKQGLRILEQVDACRILGGRKTFQGIIRRLNETYTPENGGDPIEGASCLLYSEELSASFVSDPQTLDTLTDWFDYHNRWDNVLSTFRS